MKRYRGLSRIFLLSYLVWAFGAVLCGLLLVKQGGALPIIAFVLVGIDLACIIVARVMFKHYYRVYFVLSIIGFSLLNVLCIGGLVLEIIYTNQGIPAPYAWVIGILNTVLCVLIDYVYIRSTMKIHHKRLVEEGVIQDVEEQI